MELANNIDMGETPAISIFQRDQDELRAFARKLDDLDLDAIKVKLIDKTEGPGWELDRADTAEVWYKRFLYCCYAYPESSFVPVHDIDSFWHQHILDTQKYMADCDSLFGEFFHHFPYFGIRGEEDAQNLSEAAVETFDQFVELFGESPRKQDSKGAVCSNKCKSCTPSCQKCHSCLLPSCSKCKNSKDGKYFNSNRPSLDRGKLIVNWRTPAIATL